MSLCEIVVILNVMASGKKLGHWEKVLPLRINKKLLGFMLRGEIKGCIFWLGVNWGYTFNGCEIRTAICH